MVHRDHPAPGRGSHPAARLNAPSRFEWTRQPGTGPPTSILAPLAGARVIELGCGSGHNLACLAASYAATGTGVDHDPAKISRARAAYGHLPGVRFTHADAHRYLTSAPPRSADLIVSVFGAFSFADPLPLLTQTAHVLRPGGLLAITLRADDHHDTVIVLRRR